MNKQSTREKLMIIVLLIIAIGVVIIFQMWFNSLNTTGVEYFNSDEILNQRMSDYNCTIMDVDSHWEKIVCESELCGEYGNKTYCETTTKILEVQDEQESD